MQLDLAQEGTFGCTRFFVAVLASPRKAQITAPTPPRRGRTAALAPPHKGRATAFAPSRGRHANTAVKDEPQRWSRAGPRTKGRIAKEWQDLPIVHDLREFGREKGALMARYPRDVFPNGALQGILNTWRTYLAKTSSFWMHGGNILPREGVFSVRGPFGNASQRNIAMTCHQGCTTARSRPGRRLSVHANTQRRFLARLHPMLTRKKGL